MAEKIVSPGVFTREVDQSFLPAGIAAIGAAVVGPTVKGPALVPTVVSSYGEYVRMFGDFFESGSADGSDEKAYQYLTSYTAKEYLKHHDTLTVIRILGEGFAPGRSLVSSSGTQEGVNSASGSMPILGTFGQTVDDELQITVGGVTHRFVASDPVGGLPADNAAGNLYFIGTGSDAATYLTSASAEINGLSIGVTSQIDGTSLSLTASAAGLSGNSITANSGSSGTFNNAVTLSGGTEISTVGNSFRLFTHGDGVIENSTGPEGANNLLASGSSNNIRWETSNLNTTKGTFTLTIRQGNDTSNRKRILEQHNNLTLDPNTPNYIAKVIGDQVQTMRRDSAGVAYLQLSGSYPRKSNYVRVEVQKQTLNYLDENGNVRMGSQSGSLPANASGSFHGGSDGNVAGAIGHYMYENISETNSQGLDFSDLNQTDGGSSMNDALNLLANADEYDINLMLLPGIIANTHTLVASKAIQVCEDRGDCFVILDPVPYNSSPSTVTSAAESRDTNYAAMYWPWVKYPDALTNQNVWIPPSVVMGGVYAFNDRVAAEWFAPAGLNRGGIDMAIAAERKLTHATRDTLYLSNINPLATFPNTGICAWGQKTLQKKASALDRVNVRRLLIAAKKFIASATKFLVFENNTAQTRNRFLNIVNPYLESVQQRQGLYAFKVVMDESNNTPDVIDRNQMVGQLYLQPAKTAEFIIIDFNILPTGAAFPE